MSRTDCKVVASRPTGRLWRWLGLLLVAVLAGPAWSASYTVPGALPPGCSGSGTSYSCSAGSMSSSDTVTIASSVTVTITINGNLSLNGARINASGRPDLLNLVVNGLLTPGHRAVVNANVTAREVNDGSGEVLFGGHIRTTQNGVQLAYRTVVSGNITTDDGNVVLADEVTVHGHVNANDDVQTAFRVKVYGSITAGDDVVLGQENTVGGSITVAGSNDITIGYGSQVSGTVTSASGTIDIAQAAVLRACVQVTDGSDPIKLGYQAQVAQVCCGSAGSCSRSCVQNNSTYTTPAVCSAPAAATLVARYDFAETTYNGSARELKDSAAQAGGPYHGQAQGSAYPSPASASPARSGSPGTCGYASLGGPFDGGARFLVTGLPVSTTTGAKTSVAFWMRWDGTDYTMPLGWGSHSLWFADGYFGFNSANDDLYGVSTAGLSGQWKHVVAIFTNGGLSNNELWINGVRQTLAPRRGPANTGTSTVGSTLHLGGWGQDSEYRFSGLLDQVRVYNGALTSSQIGTLYGETLACDTPALVAGNLYSLESTQLAGHYLRHVDLEGSVAAIADGSSADLKRTATFIARAGLYGSGCWSFESLDRPNHYLRHNFFRMRVHQVVSTDTGYQDATFCQVPGRAGSSGLTLESINYGGHYLSHRDDLSAWIATPDGTATFDRRATFNLRAGWATAASLHHLEIQHASGSGLTCAATTVTVRACQSADCSTLYTDGVSGTLNATGGTVVWPSGAGFSIASGSSSTTVSLQSVTTTATVLGVASSTPTASSAATCNFGSPSCTFTAASAGLQFDVPHHRAEASQTVSVRAVRSSDNSLACVPAFANVTRSVNFRCSYTNPTTGTLPVRVGGSALNASGSTAAACDSGGRAVSLAFDSTGVASTTVQYADAGQVTLNATYNGSAGTSDTGLVLSGSDSFIAAPDYFTIDAITAGPIRAGSSFSATVTARNALGGTTPNHGRETSAQRAAIGWVKRQPTGTGAVPGSFSGTGLRSFSNGAVTASDLAWTEVGRGDLVVRGSDANGYMGSGLSVFGSSLASGSRTCAAENGSCVLPGGTTATVYYGAPGGWTAKGGQTGTVACNNANFGDPISGTVKRCYYAASADSNGSVGDFIPHRFSLAASNACGSFSYAGQPVAATVTAQNAAGNTTVNYNGTATTTPAFAQAVTLADANNLGLGSLSGHSIAASAFSAGVATATPGYGFTSKTTAPQTLVLRASNGGSGASLVSSQGHAEPTLPLRSGRLRLSNAFGQANAALQLAVVAEYWAGNSWLLNSADSCTALAAASVALSNPRDASGAASTATSAAGAVALTAGSGTLTLAAPSPAGRSLSLDVALNLGSTASDQSCHGAHPATTGAARPWLRAQNGSCATTADRDPAARASFGIHSPESRKTVHVRDLF